MKVPVLLLADGAGVENDLLTVHRGGWQFFPVPRMPWTVAGAICGLLEFEAADRGAAQTVVVEATPQAGQVSGFRASMIITVPSGDGPARVPFAFPFSVGVTEVTMLAVEVKVGGVIIGHCEVPVADSSQA